MDAFIALWNGPAGGRVAVALALVALVLLPGLGVAWRRQIAHRNRETARAEAAEAEVGRLGGEVERLAAEIEGLSVEAAAGKTALDEARAGIATRDARIASLNEIVDRSENDPWTPAATLLRKRSNDLREQIDRVETELTASRDRFIAAIDARIAGRPSGDRGEHETDHSLDARRIGIAELQDLGQRLRHEAARLAGMADEFVSDTLTRSGWKNEVDRTIGATERQPAGLHQAAGWSDLVNSLRQPVPPPAAAADPN